MISPRAVPLLIRHFDAVDKSVTSRLLRNRPWLEPSLTSLLCDLLDQDTQREMNLSYTVDQLNTDLAEPDGALAVSFKIDTHEYGPDLERWVTQADLGLVIEYADFLLPDESWTAAWLLQAKRLTPDQRNPLVYSEASKFSAIDQNQKARVENLRRAVGVDFIRYLLYCPRPDNLDAVTRAKLAHLRTSALSTDIFDYTVGLALRDELLNGGASLSAGLFVSTVEGLPTNLGRVHRGLFSDTLPFSWFILQHLVPYRGVLIDRGMPPSPPGHRRSRARENPGDGREDWALAIVRGEKTAIDRLRNTVDIPANQPFLVLPQHTLTVRISVGEQFGPDYRTIRDQ